MRSERRTFPGVVVTDNGFWDTFRTVYPLLSLLYPDHLRWIADGWAAAAREGGWLPKWASPGYRNSMVGTYGDVVLADALVTGLVSPEYQTAAWDAITKDAFDVNAPSGGAVGRVGLDAYTRHGYIPYDVGVSDCVSRTLDFAYADWAIARAAEARGDAGVADSLRTRARRALRESFDTATGLMRPKSRSGQFRGAGGSGGFSAIRWGDGYTEGSAWQHSFPAFDAETLIALHGSPAKLRSKLDDMLASKAVFEAGSYKRTIHEMREFRALAMGQYGHNNQPAHHALYVYALAGDLNATNRHVRTVLDTAYGPDFYAGDEDNGEMGAWYVLAAVGLFPIPGTDLVVATAPLFDDLTLQLGASSETDDAAPPTLQIVAPRCRRRRRRRSGDDFEEADGPSDTDVADVRFNGTSMGTRPLRYNAVARGGRLEFAFAHECVDALEEGASADAAAHQGGAPSSPDASASPVVVTTHPVSSPPSTKRPETRLRPHLGTFPPAGVFPNDEAAVPLATLGLVAAAALLLGLVVGRLTARRSARKTRHAWKKPISHVV
mmetsp:Transcript_12192/g.49082  ORF Transcript_12192/g.49082 Transcript_12192/m.49082 type:complete len:550 (-) Transcript_12192:985-2634(-)